MGGTHDCRLWRMCRNARARSGPVPRPIGHRRRKLDEDIFTTLPQPRGVPRGLISFHIAPLK